MSGKPGGAARAAGGRPAPIAMHRRRFLLWGRPRAANVSALRQVAVAAYSRTPSALAIELRFVWSVSPADEWLCRAEWARLLQTSEDPPDEGGLAGGVLAPVVSDAGDLTLEGHVLRSERLVTSQRVAERRPPVPFRPFGLHEVHHGHWLSIDQPREPCMALALGRDPSPLERESPATEVRHRGFVGRWADADEDVNDVLAFDPQGRGADMLDGSGHPYAV